MYFPVVVGLRWPTKKSHCQEFVFQRQWWTAAQLDSDAAAPGSQTRLGEDSRPRQLLDLFWDVFSDVAENKERSRRDVNSFERLGGFILRCLRRLRCV